MSRWSEKGMAVTQAGCSTGAAVIVFGPGPSSPVNVWAYV